jgi:hypothetical protein
MKECSGFGSLAENFLLFEHCQKSREFPENSLRSVSHKLFSSIFG